LDHGYAEGKYEATVKNARTESKRERIGAGIAWRLNFLAAHTTSQISDPKAQKMTQDIHDPRAVRKPPFPV